VIGKSLVAGIVFFLGFAANAKAQTSPRFDAATIKLDKMRPADSRMHGGPGTNSPTRVTWELAWLDSLLAKAFHVDVRHISGPSWMSASLDAPLYTLTAVMPR
jgi:uncharacterized protein (TIGR03435 family)